MIRLWSPDVNHRLRFAAACVFTHVLEVGHTWVTAPEEAHLCYAAKREGPGLHIMPTALGQLGVVESDPAPGPSWHGWPTLGPTEGGIGFDLLGAVVFLAARMEEYGRPKRDQHGRFPAAESWMGRHGCLDRPLIDGWAQALATELSARFADLTFPTRTYNVLSTVDVDSAYAYRGKGFKRSLGGFWGDLKRGDAANRRLRWRVLRGKQPDPFDTYETILQEHARHSIPPLFFFLVADFDRPHDINLSHRRPALRALVLELADRAEVGAHPGYRAAESAERLALEIGRVADLKLGQVDHTRYHYLRGRFPEAFARLAHQGLRHDHTMGYADAFGFRTGSCTPLPFFDLKAEVLTPLMLHPTAFMDTTAVRYLHLDPEATIAAAVALAKEVRAVSGTLELLWHNEAWSNWKHWEGWSHVPEKVLAAVGPIS